MRHRSDSSDLDGPPPELSDGSAGPAPDVEVPGDGDGNDGRRPRRVRVGVGAAVVLLIVAAVVAVLVSATAQRGSSLPLPTGTGAVSRAPSSPGSGPDTAGSSAIVHVTGAVRTPGLVVLHSGARVVDAVAAAGGFADGADAAALNLARPVADGEQLVVPRVGEQPPSGAVANVGSSPGGAAAVPGAPVNLNTATQPELENLPRIGPALAQRILDWRAANGRFVQATDLLKVSGIGQKLFDGLKDRVTV
ncbi:ComEA family DNA-binding protein [Leifsonia sp. 2TAF2]|uniref:ComEA family DNA-binding protein n=1 Tax=Leifsonia sp. 2TAF2 TaxID=3233009 RepID=UPI003F9DDDCF